MANITQLLALLGAQGAGNIPLPPDTSVTGTPFIPPAEQGPDIEVVAPNTRPDNPMYDLIRREPQVQQVQQAPADTSVFPRTEASPQELARAEGFKNAPEHKGLFGIKGTFRDVLGTVGDALLAAGGQRPLYKAQREKEALIDSLIGFGSRDPEEQRALLERVAQVNPEMALRIAQQYQMDDYRQGQLQNAQARQDSQDNRAVLAQRIQKAKLMPGLLSAARGNPEQQAALKAWYEDPTSSIQDLDPETIASSAITPYQKELVRQGDERIGVARQNADANTKRANRAPAGRPSNPTKASLAAAALAKPAAKRSEDEQALVDNFVGRNRGKGSSKTSDAIKARLGGSPKAGGKMVIRNGKLVSQ